MFLYSFFLLALPALFAAASQSDVGEPHFLDSGAALSTDGAENRTTDPNLSAKIGHLPLAPVLSSPDGFVSRASQLASHRGPVSSEAEKIANKFILDIRLLSLAHEKDMIVGMFDEGFVYQACNKDKKIFNRYEVAEFLSSQEDIFSKPLTISDYKHVSFNDGITFNLKCPSLFNGTVYVTLFKFDHKVYAMSALTLC